jgi:hypothetical protein
MRSPSPPRLTRVASAVIAIPLFVSALSAQLSRFPTGANRGDVAWHELGTEHFVVIYHDGLDSVAREAADVAEAIYPVVTGNLGTEVAGRTPLFLSNLDDIPNAFAFGDAYMFIWMRGIVDDVAPAGIRSSGRAKWLRGVITHEFTHIVIEHATATWSDAIVPSPDVPRWFNEGVARAMEPDAWTSDLDMALRLAAVNGRLGYDLAEPGILDGTLLYETGHSIVRYMLRRFGDSVIAKVLDRGRGFFGYDFNAAVSQATGVSVGEIRADWLRAVTAMYAAEYAGREEPEEFAPAATEHFEVVLGARYAADRRTLAVLGSLGRGRPTRLHLLDVGDSLRARGEPRLLLDEAGVDAEFSWSPEGNRIVIGKYRYGAHRALVHDLFLVDLPSGRLERLTSDASVRDPAWSPDGSTIVAIEKRVGVDNLVLVDPVSATLRPLTHYSGDIQLATPSWSPDGRSVAFSLFDESGMRSVAVVDRDGSPPRVLTRDTAISRYPVWSPDGRRIAFTSHADGVPNIHVMDVDGSDRHAVTAVGGGIWSVQWAPSSDSILALAFDTRDRITPRLVPATRTAEAAPQPFVREKFTAWRTTSFSRRVPLASALASAVIVDSGAYHSFLHVRPLVPLIPLLEPGIDRDDGASRLRPGLASVWFDPQAKHILFGYLTADVRLHDPGAELVYVDNQLPVSAMLHADYSLARRGLLDGRDYVQRNRGLSLSLDLPIADPDILDIGHHFFVGAARRSLEPWGGPALEGDSTRSVPELARLTELTAGYRYGGRSIYIDARYRHAEPALASDRRYDRVDATLATRWPIVATGDLAIIARAEAAAHFGPQVAQERLGLGAEDQLDGRLLNLFDILDLERSYRVRGHREAAPGDRVVVASAALQTRLPLLEDLFPLLSLLRPQSLIFVEAGAAWQSDRTSIADADWRLGAGGELRTELLPQTWLGGGVAYGVNGPRGDRWDLYLRITQGL